MRDERLVFASRLKNSVFKEQAAADHVNPPWEHGEF